MLVLAASLLLAAAAANTPPEPAVPPGPSAEDSALVEDGTGRDQKYPGWVLLYRVPDLTIVYPAASGRRRTRTACPRSDAPPRCGRCRRPRSRW